jgi:tetratricopeptide (TPR) repeat protein
MACAAPLTQEDCGALNTHGKRAEADACFTTLSRSTNAYLRAEGFWGLQQYDPANEAFRLAVGQSSDSKTNAHHRVRWGLLLHERFNNKDADDLFNEALKLDPSSAEAYLGLAQVSADGFDGQAVEYASKALALDPKLVEAHELLAKLALENSHTPEAVAEADKALALSSDALEAMAIHAAVEVLADRPPDMWFTRMHAVNSTYGDGYALVGSLLVLNRRYEDGVAYYRKAIDADPKLWAARSQLGINLMRLGQEQEPLQQLEMSYNNGQRDPATVNSLRLLDSYKNFVTFHDATTNLKLRKTEAELLRPYFDAELHKSIATYEKKYKMKLPVPVQLEVYPDHEDFAVRTMGMPGLGALGVTFGEVVAMDSPSGRTPGEFNWGSTLWHEMSHVFILSATNHRVPRWFAEGLAVHEEGEASPEWANRATPEVLLAIHDKKLLPVTDIDRGFIYPEYPSQVIVSYFEAGSMCDYIKQRWGDAKLLDMVHSFAALKTTPEVIQTNLQMSPEQFDKEFMTWLDKKYGQTATNFDTWRRNLKDLATLAAVNDSDAVIGRAPEVLALYPEYVGDANAYEFLAQAYLAKSDKQKAMTTLTTYEAMGGMSPGALEKLASLEEELDHPKEAAATLDRINFIYPEAENLHRHLGTLWLAQQNYAGAEREYAAVLALNPVDKASAEFDLAQAYFAAGDKAKAEDSVLLALEAAPGFRPAQKLLLQINSAKNEGTVKPDKPN